MVRATGPVTWEEGGVVVGTGCYEAMTAVGKTPSESWKKVTPIPHT